MKRWIAILILAGGGCSSVSVSTDYDPHTDFSRLRTYGWLHEGRTQPADSLTGTRIERAVEDGLLARGFARAAAGWPDFLVAYQVSVGTRVETVPGSLSYSSYGWHRGYVENTEVRTYDEGTLILDVIDPSAKTLLWRGTAKSVVDPKATPEEREAKIREAVEKLLEKFPPGPRRAEEPTP